MIPSLPRLRGLQVIRRSFMTVSPPRLPTTSLLMSEIAGDIFIMRLAMRRREQLRNMLSDQYFRLTAGQSLDGSHRGHIFARKRGCRQPFASDDGFDRKHCSVAQSQIRRKRSL